MLKTTVVGSYPVPSWLPIARTREALRDAVLAVMKIQELAGIDVISDGELSRFDVNHPETNGMIDYFLAPLDGMDVRITRADVDAFRRQDVAGYRREPAAILRGPLGEGRLHLRRDWEFAKGLSRKPIKFTVTGPHMLSKVVTDEHYRDPRRLAMEIAGILAKQVAGIDAPVVQVDEANITGHPEEGPWAAEAMNRVLAAVKGEKGVHACFGNYGGQTVQKGTWRKLVDYLNRLDADHLVLECARREPKELSFLRDIRKDIRLGVGVIDIKDNGIESPDEVARRIEVCARAAGGVKRLAYVHPDCGFWMLKRNVVDGKMAALVRGRDLFLKG